MTPELTRKCINTIGFLAVDAVEKANSGHPGMRMGAAPMAFVLWSRHMRFNPKEPRWANRDRFILSAGHGSMLLYAMLHLTGFDVTMEDLKSFRQYGSKTPGHPAFRDTPGVEATTAPLVEGIDRALAAGKGDPRPPLSSVRTVLGFGAPHKANTHAAHGSPLGKDEVKATKENLGWPLEPAFLVPDEVRQFWAGRIEELKKGYDEWQRKFAQWQSANPAKAKLWNALAARETPGDLPEQLPSVVTALNAPEATRKHGQAVLQKAAQLLPGLGGGPARLHPSNFTFLQDR